MKRSRVLVLLVSLFVLLGATSCIRPWQTLRKVVPRPYPPNTRFVLLPLSYRDVRINHLPMHAYMARKNPVDQGKWQQIMDEMRQIFADNFRQNVPVAAVRLGSKPRPGELVIDPRVEDIETGFYAALVNKSSYVRVRVLIGDGRKLFDEFVIQSRTSPTPNNSIIPTYPSIASRVRRDASILGSYAGWYLRDRLKEAVK